MARKPINILIISDSAAERQNLQRLQDSTDRIRIAGEGESEDEAARLLSITRVDLIMVGAGKYGVGYNLTARLACLEPLKPVILITRKLSETTRSRAVESGASGVILFPFDRATLEQVMASVLPETGDRSQKTLLTGDRPDFSSRVRKGRLLTYFSNKGGVGKTFCAVNTAVALAEISKQKVILVDLDFDYGSAALSLNIENRFTLADVIRNKMHREGNLPVNTLQSHESGLKVLPGGSPFGNGLALNKTDLEAVLLTLLEVYDYVVLDMPTRIPGYLAPSFELASLLLPVTNPDIAAVRNVRLFLKMLLGAGYPSSKIKLLFNRADANTGIRPGDVEAVLNKKIYQVIPADYKLAALSSNRGSPMVLLFPRSKVSRAFCDLASKLTRQN